jgi:hypothetical protein
MQKINRTENQKTKRIEILTFRTKSFTSKWISNQILKELKEIAYLPSKGIIQHTYMQVDEREVWF